MNDNEVLVNFVQGENIIGQTDLSGYDNGTLIIDIQNGIFLGNSTNNPDLIANAGSGSNSPIILGDAENSAVLNGSYKIAGTNYSNKTVSQVSLALGAANTSGRKGWYYTKVNLSTNSIFLSKSRATGLFTIKIDTTTATTPTDSTFVSGWSVGDVVSIVNDKKYDNCAVIVGINGNMITLDKLPFDDSTIKTSATAIGDYNEPDEFSIIATRIADDDNLKIRSVTSYDKGDIDFGGGAMAEGVQTFATNIGAHAEGIQTVASGQYSHTEGFRTQAGYASHAEGVDSIAINNASHAEGRRTLAKGANSHAEGRGAFNFNDNVSINNITAPLYVFDNNVIKNEWISRNESGTDLIHAALGDYSHVEGLNNLALGNCSHVEGQRNIAIGTNAHSEGWKTSASARSAHAEGTSTIASGQESHAEGNTTTASGANSHAEGINTNAAGQGSHAEGEMNIVFGRNSHIEGRGQGVLTDVTSSNAESKWDEAELAAKDRLHIGVGNYVHVEGFNNIAISDCSHVEGQRNKASGASSHAEGWKTQAIGARSHSEGQSTKASGSESHAEGNTTTASGANSHAEGFNTIASGKQSHAEGYKTQANGANSHASGLETITNNDNEFACGKYNKSVEGETLFSVGIGDDDANRKNAFEIRHYITDNYKFPETITISCEGGNDTDSENVEIYSLNARYIDKVDSIVRYEVYDIYYTINTIDSNERYDVSYWDFLCDIDGVTDQMIDAQIEIGDYIYIDLNERYSDEDDTEHRYYVKFDDDTILGSITCYIECDTGNIPYTLKLDLEKALQILVNDSDISSINNDILNINNDILNKADKSDIIIKTDTTLQGIRTVYDVSATNVAKAGGTVAFGTNTIALNKNAVAIGGSTVSNVFSVSDTPSTIKSKWESYSPNESFLCAAGNDSVALGKNNLAYGSQSIALGFANESIGSHSFTAGGYNIANGSDSVAIGRYLEVNSQAEFACGIFNKSSSDTNTIFSIGIGSSSRRKNALTVNKNGDIFIGDDTVTLQAKIANLESKIAALEERLLQSV